MKQSLFVRGFVKARVVRAKLVVMLGVLLAALLITSVAAAQGNVHVVRRGENLSTIAQSYGMSLRQLMNINGISNPNLVYVGQQLLISGVASGPYGTRPPAHRRAAAITPSNAGIPSPSLPPSMACPPMICCGSMG